MPSLCEDNILTKVMSIDIQAGNIALIIPLGLNAFSTLVT